MKRILSLVILLTFINCTDKIETVSGERNVFILHSENPKEEKFNFKIDKKTEAIEAVCATFEKEEQVLNKMEFDGIRMEFSDWWFNIRPSNTEPYLRFIAEAKNKEKLTSVVSRVKSIVDALS